ncbi:hypothetical protein TNCV_1943501 [Trichonephila clavipes]|nr:hypothetical protein TNCV_1943501 [Trichonephila clavipes]
MDFPPSVAEKSYNKSINKLQLYSKQVAEVSMQSAASEEINFTISSDIASSGDGTWKASGYCKGLAPSTRETRKRVLLWTVLAIEWKERRRRCSRT